MKSATNRFLVLVCLVAAVAPASFGSAQAQSVKPWRLGFLGAGSASAYASRVDAMRDGLRQLGYVEGQNITIEYRWADQKYERLPSLAAEVVRLGVDLIITHGEPGSRAAKEATTTIPIVIASAGDAVGSGLVASLARPGGNVTGSSFFQPEMVGKRLQLLKQTIPAVVRVTFLTNPSNVTHRRVIDGVRPSAHALGLQLDHIEVRDPNDVDRAFADMAKRRIDAVLLLEDPMLNSQAARIAALAVKNRLPLVGSSLHVAAGGFMAYGVDLLNVWRGTAVFVDKIFKGAKPSEVPVQQPTKFELIINMRTAKLIGVSVPARVLSLADTVIE